MSTQGKASLAILTVVAFLAGILFTTMGANVFEAGERIGLESRAGDTSIELDADSPILNLEESFVEVSDRVNRTVVQIRSEQVVEGRRSPFEGTPFEDFFGGSPGGEDQIRPGLGSGVIATSDGHIITNNHVIENADNLEVRLFDGRYYPAEVVGTDPGSDLAVINIDADGLDTISFGDHDTLQIGQWALAFGSPLSEDLENTVTAGIVSAKNRTSAEISARINLFSELIQTDAAINPGNSGGPLVNIRGELIGINSAIMSRTGGNVGIGFAIPVNVVENVVDQLIANGTVRRAYLGVVFDRVPRSLAEALDVPRGTAQLTNVQSGTPAERAGLQPGDIIISVDGRQLRDYNQIRTIIANKRPGETVDIEVMDESGGRRTVTVELDEQPDSQALAGRQPSDTGSSDDDVSGEMEEMGISVTDATPEALRRLGIRGVSDVEGVLITEVSRTSRAYRDGELRQGFIITEVNREPIRNQKEFMDVYRDLPSGDSFIIRVLRPQRTPDGSVELSSFFTALQKP
jgi:serine protease Do